MSEHTSGFRVDYSSDEPRAELILRTDPWSCASIEQLRYLGEKLNIEVPDTDLRRSLRALEASQGLREGQLLTNLRKARHG